MNQFLATRTPFIVSNGAVFFASAGLEQTCKEWVEQYGLSEEEWASSVRGYVSEGRIQFFTGDNYRPVPFNRILPKYIAAAAAKHADLYPNQQYRIYNGVLVGEDGKSWNPMSEVFI